MSEAEDRFTAENLETLADFIEKHAPQEQIDMEAYVSREGEVLDSDVVPSNLHCLVDIGDTTPPTLGDIHECGTCFCAVGWEAVRSPEAAAKCNNWEDLQVMQFPGTEEVVLHDSKRGMALSGDDYCFGGEQSRDKADVISRLREVAQVLRGRLPA